MNAFAARNIPYGDPRQHRPLADLLPLGTPLSVFVDPSSACNLSCGYCPTGRTIGSHSRRHSRGTMELTLFCKILRDLGNFSGRVSRLHLYKDGEPLLNTDLERMVMAAKRGDVAKSVELTTNGTLLTRERSRSLIESGLDRIRISVQPPHDKRPRPPHSRDLYHQVLKNVEALWQEKERLGSALHVHAKTLDLELTDSQAETFHRDFADIADSTHIDTAMGWSLSTSLDLALGEDPATDMSGRTPLDKERIVCPHPFYSLAINHDGRVSACCVDWSMGALVGNVAEQALTDIWDGEALREFRVMHLNAMRQCNVVCGDCQYVWGASRASSLDKERVELLRAYSA